MKLEESGAGRGCAWGRENSLPTEKKHPSSTLTAAGQVYYTVKMCYGAVFITNVPIKLCFIKRTPPSAVEQPTRITHSSRSPPVLCPTGCYFQFERSTVCDGGLGVLQALSETEYLLDAAKIIGLLT